jgi:hypothetical protein
LICFWKKRRSALTPKGDRLSIENQERFRERLNGWGGFRFIYYQPKSMKLTFKLLPQFSFTAEKYNVTID